jgi:hypothetical protein
MKNNLLLTALLIFSTFHIAFAQLKISTESGLAFTQYNDVRAPNGGGELGTFFSLKNDFTDTQTPIYFRAEAAYLLADKHTIELTAVPLVVESTGLNLPTLSFEGKEFTAGNATGRYQFNTYRLAYRYKFINKEKFQLSAGATLLVRDAEISLSQNEIFASNTDLGFVPLLSFDTRYDFNSKLSLALKGDALVGPVGRAEDVFLGLVYQASSRVGIRAGYRVIEGGADVDQVYNFAFFHFASVGLQVTL